MSASYSTDTLGCNSSFTWVSWLFSDSRGRWWVMGHHGFCRSGWAVIDDFGDLVEVPL